MYEGVPNQSSIERLGGMALLATFPSDLDSPAFALSDDLDLVIAATAMMLLSPLLIAIALRTWATVDRPILVRQWWVDLNGRRFDLLKFRSMRDAPAEEVAASEALAGRVGLAPGGVEGVDRRTRVVIRGRSE